MLTSPCHWREVLLSCQVDQAHRGFSFSKDAPLDMRMGPGAAASAEEIVNTWTEEELGRVFREYGEERFWKGIAQRYQEMSFCHVWICTHKF